MDKPWPPHLPASSIRFARPTSRLEACATFYRDVLGLRALAEFREQDGWAVWSVDGPRTPIGRGEGRWPSPTPMAGW